MVAPAQQTESLEQGHEAAPAVVAAQAVEATVLVGGFEGRAYPAGCRADSVDVCVQQECRPGGVVTFGGEPDVVSFPAAIEPLGFDELFERVGCGLLFPAERGNRYELFEQVYGLAGVSTDFFGIKTSVCLHGCHKCALSFVMQI